MADEVIEKNHYFRQKYDATRHPGASPYQKITAAIHKLAYDISANFLNVNLRISTNSTLDYLKEFSRAIVKIFNENYLREPNAEDIRQLNNTQRGFVGMLRSIDCMYWKWKNCSTAWPGQYQSGHNKVLQAVASKNLWIRHAYFRASGCNNDINVLEESDLFDRLFEGDVAPCSYKINRTQYDMGYYLADGIYPSWACFMKSIPSRLSQKDCTFSQYQEGVRKDVERAFGVL